MALYVGVDVLSLITPKSIIWNSMSMVFSKIELTANTCVDLTVIEYERPVDLEISMVKMPKDENLNFLL